MELLKKVCSGIICLLLFTSCAPREVKPPRTGKIFARHSHATQALDFNYSVGQLDGELKVVGTIINTYMSDLDYFKLDLKISTPDKRVVYKDSTPTFDIEEHGSHTFSFSVPPLHGPHRINFSFEYDYYEFAETGRRGRCFMRSETDEWSKFEDLIDFP